MDIRLPVLKSVSPTLAELLRLCKLRAALSRATEVDAFVLGSPKAWLGTAYHEVLAKVAEIIGDGNAEGIEVRLREAWSVEVQKCEGVANSHPLNHRFGSPAKWPGFHLVYSTLRLRVRGLAASGEARTGARSAGSVPTERREKFFRALDDKLTGRLDLMRGDEIVDFKTGSVEETLEGGETQIRSAYARQLRIYAFLVHSATGEWPKRGILLPLSGPEVVVDLDPAECEREATEAVRLLDEYNDAVRAAKNAMDIATPSPEACLWCQYKPLCPAIWENVSPTWRGRLESEIVEGTLEADPSEVRRGAAVSLVVNVDRASVDQRRVVISPLAAKFHAPLKDLKTGTRVRVTGLRERADGSLVPTIWTQVVPTESQPSLVVLSG